MKFCKYCGTPLEDNAVCTCAEAQAEYAAAQPAPVAQPTPVTQPTPVAQPTPVVQQPVQQSSVYATTPTPKPAGDGKFVKALKNLPVSFMSYFRNSKEVVVTAKRENDWLLSLLYIVALFISLLIFGCCVFGKLDSSISGITSMFGASGLVKTFNFGNILLFSLIMTVLITVFYVVVRFALIKIFNKTVDAKTTFIESFIDAAINSIPAIPLFIIGGLLAFISPYIAIFAAIFVLIFYIIMLTGGVSAGVPEPKNNALFTLITSLFIAIAIAVIAYAGYQMIIATAQSTVSSTQSYLNNIGSSFLDGLFG